MTRLLRQGDEGQDVRAVQDALNFQIRRLAALAVDGIFGPLTDARVREFQGSNHLQVDGVVGPNTSAYLFEEMTVPLTVVLLPRLQLTFPGQTQFGLQPPRLVPPLQFPGTPPGVVPTVTPPFNLQLPPLSTSSLPPAGAPANLFNLQLATPRRNDPSDPSVRARKSIVELIDELPVDSKFKALVTGLVPNPEHKISPPKPGFTWGVSPLFNPLDPNLKGFGASGHAAATVRVTGGARPDRPSVFFFVQGDGKLSIDLLRSVGQTGPKAQASGTLIMGIKGTL